MNTGILGKELCYQIQKRVLRGPKLHNKKPFSTTAMQVNHNAIRTFLATHCLDTCPTTSSSDRKIGVQVVYVLASREGVDACKKARHVTDSFLCQEIQRLTGLQVGYEALENRSQLTVSFLGNKQSHKFNLEKAAGFCTVEVVCDPVGTLAEVNRILLSEKHLISTVAGALDMRLVGGCVSPFLLHHEHTCEQKKSALELMNYTNLITGLLMAVTRNRTVLENLPVTSHGVPFLMQQISEKTASKGAFPHWFGSLEALTEFIYDLDYAVDSGEKIGPSVTFKQYVAAHPDLSKDVIMKKFRQHVQAYWPAGCHTRRSATAFQLFGMQPIGEELSAVALFVGAMENKAMILDWLLEHLNDYLRYYPSIDYTPSQVMYDYHQRVIRDGVRAKEPFQGMLTTFLELCREGLRHYGESHWVQGLFHRVAIARLPIEYNRPCSLYSDSTVRDKVLVSEKSLQRRYVSERLSHVYASNLCVFTDMSGTVLTSAPREGEDGFPMSVQRQLHRLIQNGAKLVVITGDALNMVVAHLITPLSGQLHRPFYVVTEAGASFYRVENGQVKELDLGLKKTFSQVEKNTLLKLFRDAFKKILPTFHVSDVLKKEVIENGHLRFDLDTDILGSDFGQLSFEFSPHQMGIDCPVLDQSEKKQALIRCIRDALLTIPSLSNADVTINSSHNYVNATLYTKDEAIRTCMTHLFTKEEVAGRVLLSLGDSANDAHMMQALLQYETQGHQVVNAFVGERRTWEKEAFSDWSYCVEGNMEGTRYVLDQIN